MLVDGGGKFALHLVDPNGSREETVLGVVVALDALHAASLHVFSALRERLDEQRSAVAALTHRLDAAADQVEVLKGPHKRALRILSPAKYPPKHESLLTLKSVVVKTGGAPPPPPRSLDVGGGDVGGEVNKVREGRLGKPPPLQTADSFILFNAQDNPYKGKREDGGTRRVEEVAEVVTEEPLTPPHEDDNDDFYYNPSTTSLVPQIDVPDILPYLPGIVDFQSASPLFEEPPPVVSVPTAAPPLPPPTAKAVVVAPSTIPSVAPPPPPPPPPPPTVEIPQKIEVGVAERKATKEKEKKSSGGGVDDRSNLMEAIRAAGGVGKAGLRSSAAKKEKRATSREETAGPDLMADLKHSLAMRRKGISGQGDLMERLAAVIPQVEDDDAAEDEDDSADDWDE